MKKTWQKPKLVILFRGRPEEYVLSACKEAAGTGPASNLGDCEVNGLFCGECEGNGGS